MHQVMNQKELVMDKVLQKKNKDERQNEYQIFNLLFGLLMLFTMAIVSLSLMLRMMMTNESIALQKIAYPLEAEQICSPFTQDTMVLVKLPYSSSKYSENFWDTQPCFVTFSKEKISDFIYD